MISRCALCATTFVLMTSAVLRADTLVLSPSKDNTIFGLFAESNSNGLGDHIFVGKTNNGSNRRTLISFDLSSIPIGSVINNVTLELYLSRTNSNSGNRVVNVHRLTSDWGEGTSDAEGSEGPGTSATIGDATWDFSFYNTIEWITPGGDYDPVPSGSTIVGNQQFIFYSWSSPGMTADLQTWLDNPSTNLGWILIGDESTNRTTKRFDSKDNDIAAQRPKLTIDFTPPANDGACCFPDDSCQVLSSPACAFNAGVYQGDATTCTPNPCTGLIIGACCQTDGTCSITTDVDCGTLGGLFQGDGTLCAPNPCPQPIGACCPNSGICVEVSEDDCDLQSGTWQGAGTICTPGLCPVILEPFVDEMTIPPLAIPTSGTPGGVATYDMEIVQVTQKLHRDLPPTPLWTYNGIYPGPTILARSDMPVTVNWINNLRNPDTSYRTDHLLDVDPCPHGAENLPKVVTHLHGGHVPAAYDGYPEFTFLPGQSETYIYPNNQLPATIWYHDHALGITRLNVYLGLAGAYVITDAVEEAFPFPDGEYDVPLIIQDRDFNPDGTLSYPSTWTDHYAADNILVNGTVWPKFTVKQGRYRFRILNGCNSRTLRLELSNFAPFMVIGTDGGLLQTAFSTRTITIAPAERVDAIVNFGPYTPGTEIILKNNAPAPFPGTPGVGVVPNVMKFIVDHEPGFQDATPTNLRPLEVLEEADAVQTRDFELRKVIEPCAGSEWLINDLGWNDITEQPVLGSTEIWRFINNSGMMHPMHMHLVFFQVLDRQMFEIVNDEIVPIGSPAIPTPTERGWKDTVQVGPNEIVRVIARFEDYTGLFPYHCHILEHEDHEMMRQFRTICVKGDTNQDTLVDGDDISGFVYTLVDGADEGTAVFCATDINDDATLDTLADLPMFVDCLLAGSCP